MSSLWTVVVVLVVLAGLGFALSARIVTQYERGVLFRLGRVVGIREPGLTFIVPLIDTLRRVSLRGAGAGIPPRLTRNLRLLSRSNPPPNNESTS